MSKRTSAIEAAFTARSQADGERWQQLLHPVFSFTDVALNISLSTRQELMCFVVESKRLYPDTKYRISAAHECEMQVCVEWVLESSRLQVRLPQGSSKVSIATSGVSVMTFEADLITQWCDYYDSRQSDRLRLSEVMNGWHSL